jgi:hypothetical protein
LRPPVAMIVPVVLAFRVSRHMTAQAFSPPSLSNWRKLPGRLALALMVAAAISSPGCFSGGTVLEAHEEETNLVRLDEIDIGEFRITLPHAPGAAGGGVVEFHAFGQVARRDRDKVASTLVHNSAEFRYRVLLLVRGLTRSQLDEPRLQSLRDQITKVANASLDEKMVKNVGFYRFAFEAH